MAKKRTKRAKRAKRITVADLCLRLSTVEAALKILEPVARDAEIKRRRAELEQRYQEERRERLRSREKSRQARLTRAVATAHALGTDLADYISKCDDNPYPPKYVKLLKRSLELLREQNALRRESYELFKTRRALNS